MKTRTLSLLLSAFLATLAATAAGQQPNPACSTCTWAVRLLDDALCDAQATDFVIDTIQKNLCPVFGVDPAQCEQMTEMLVPVAIEWLRESASPQQLCTSAGVCQATSLQVELSKVRQNRLRRRAVQDGAACSMCEYVVTKVKAEIDDPVALEDLKQKAVQACTALPADIATTCMDLVSNYGDMLIQMIDTLDPQASCAAVGMCTAKLLSKVQLPPLPKELLQAMAVVQSVYASTAHQLGADNMCQMCRLTVLQVHTLVSNPTIQAQITNYTKALCDSMGASMADTCRLYVDTYAPDVYTALLKYLQPNPICQAMGMCDAPAPPTRASSTPVTTSTASATATTTKPGGSSAKKFLPGATLDEAAYFAYRNNLKQVQQQGQNQQGQQQGQQQAVGLDVANARLASALVDAQAQQQRAQQQQQQQQEQLQLVGQVLQASLKAAAQEKMITLAGALLQPRRDQVVRAEEGRSMSNRKALV